MIHSLKAYIRYRIAAKTKYGIHSPFLFDFVTRGLQSKSNGNLEKAFLMRRELLADKSTIGVTDFGAGSKVLGKSERNISQIAARAGITAQNAILLARTVDYFKPKTILEIGTSLGISTAFLSAAAPGSKIITLEGCPATAGVAKEKHKKFGFDNIALVVGSFEDTLDDAIKDRTFDLIFFDGNHRKEPTIAYFEKCLHHSSGNSVFIFDDIHWSGSMESAWDHIQNHKNVTLSVDLFKWGMVFFHKGRAKQHFTIRV